MALKTKLLLAFLSVVVAIFIHNYYQSIKSLPPPTLNYHRYWGPGNPALYKENTAILPHNITVSPAVIEDLKQQLKRSLHLPEPLEGVGFEYGFNSRYLQTVVNYWRDDYLKKWSKREEYLTKFPHYQTEIQGLKIHFLHVKPSSAKKSKRTIPLLLLHGWPGSVREFYELIPLLTATNKNTDYVFEVIAPSLPGYGWSQGSSKKDFGPTQIAIIMRNLMLRLNHEKFMVHGGDWGAVIGHYMAALFPQHMLGFHSTMCSGRLFSIKPLIAPYIPSLFYDEKHKAFAKPLPQLLNFILMESGYMHLQATKPDTIGLVLSHNPIGLAAYILEKFSTWTNPAYISLNDGGLTKDFTLDTLLDNVMIYYVTNSITTSQRLYAEFFSKAERDLQMDRVAVTVPTGCAHFINELMQSSDSQIKEIFHNLIHSSYHLDGGHFAAMQLPKVLYSDIVAFVNKIDM